MSPNAQPNKSYQLTPEEQKAILQLVSIATGAKARITDLQHELQKHQAQIEAAQRDSAVADAQVNGALWALGTVHGLKNPKLTSDGSLLTE